MSGGLWPKAEAGLIETNGSKPDSCRGVAGPRNKLIGEPPGQSRQGMKRGIKARYEICLNWCSADGAGQPASLQTLTMASLVSK